MSISSTEFSHYRGGKGWREAEGFCSRCCCKPCRHKKKLQPTEGRGTRMAGSNGTLSQNEGRAGSQEDLLLFFVSALVLIQKGMFACPWAVFTCPSLPECQNHGVNIMRSVNVTPWKCRDTAQKVLSPCSPNFLSPLMLSRGLFFSSPSHRSIQPGPLCSLFSPPMPHEISP